jgi:transitional endoplasmic reticulum ATPase
MNALSEARTYLDTALGNDARFTRDMLSPVQTAAYDRLLHAVKAAPFVTLGGACGSGQTTILRLLADVLGAEYITTEAIVVAVQQRDPMVCADTVLMVVEDALSRADLVIIEDIAVLSRYNTAPFPSAVVPLEILSSLISGTDKRIVMAANLSVGGGNGWDLADMLDRVQMVPVEAFGAEDYRVILGNRLPKEILADVDMELVWRHAPGLSGHDLCILAGLLLASGAPSTESIIEHINEQLLVSNVRQEEVEALSFASLPGSEAIAAKLETHIMLPLEQQGLAQRLGIRPKRGALLYGPPGTGKTSIGRALAHRMGGKFFLIDGSFTTEPPIAFFARVTDVVKQAKENAPAVLFVDDADVLFGIAHIAGFSRYLLSLLDGVESESAGQVCLMMTAMNASRIPGSILRSGRVELWLETALPDDATRARIIARWLEETLFDAGEIDLDALAKASDGFTPADLRRVVTDAKSLHAMDLIAGSEARDAQFYLNQAITDLLDLRDRMADNLRDESLRINSLSAIHAGQTKPKYAAGIGGLAASGETCPHVTGGL